MITVRYPIAEPQPPDLLDMAATAGDLAIALKYAGKRLAWGVEYDDEIAKRGALKDLRKAHESLATLILDVEMEIR